MKYCNMASLHFTTFTAHEIFGSQTESLTRNVIAVNEE